MSAEPITVDTRRRERWEESYLRQENFIFEPKDEVIRFLSRYVKKRVGVTAYRKVLLPANCRDRLRALDYGCGIGSQSLFMAHKLGIDAVGLDLSEAAIQVACELRDKLPKLEDYASLEFKTLKEGQCIPFAASEFDVTICDAVLDSMPFELARESMVEMTRVTSKYIFFSVISGHEMGDATFDKEVTVDHRHEYGTIQSYFTPEKIDRLIDGLGFSITSLQLQLYQNMRLPHGSSSNNHLLSDDIREHGRYFVAIERSEKR